MTQRASELTMSAVARGVLPRGSRGCHEIEGTRPAGVPRKEGPRYWMFIDFFSQALFVQ
jgi:hypothetical protein